MTWPVVHAILNHFPIVLTVLGMIAALLGTIWPRRAFWIYAVVSLTISGVFAFPAWYSGDESADSVRRAWYIAPGAIRQHAQSADSTLWVLLAVGVIAALAWWRLVRLPADAALPTWLRVLVLVASIAGFGAVTYTGWLGGKVVVDSPILASPVPPARVDTLRVPGAPGTTTSPPAPITR